MALGSNQPLSIRNLPQGKMMAGITSLPSVSQVSRICGSFNISPVTGIALKKLNSMAVVHKGTIPTE
jgi:hypothetical protein